MVVVTHGEDAVCQLFRDRLETELGLTASAPYSGWIFDLAEGRYTVKPEPVRIKKEVKLEGAARKAAGIFANLMEAAQRLVEVVKKNEGGANKDLKKFTEEIHRLCDKWER